MINAPMKILALLFICVMLDLGGIIMTSAQQTFHVEPASDAKLVQDGWAAQLAGKPDYMSATPTAYMFIPLLGSQTAATPQGATERMGKRVNTVSAPQLAIEPYVRPELSKRMKNLHPVIMAAAANHNDSDLSGMSDQEFAEVMVLLLYNEHNGWVEDAIEPLRFFTPLYQDLQVQVNQSGIGSNFSVWPTNLRPSVALEILRQEVPVPGSRQKITVPVTVDGSQIAPDQYVSDQHLFAAITTEISQDELAMEYLAANLARGVYRARFEGFGVSWRTLAAWHNQGIVNPEQIRDNPVASDYVRRASAYLPLARRFVANGGPEQSHQ
ncbi:MAG: hypothetical protein MI924_10185 [Chloroflexales bacterium]|nr:hypothetical protein [Chloroflexales bacterium]